MTRTITNSTTESAPCPGESETEEIMRYFIVVCLAIIIIVSIVGNCMVCIAFKVNKQLRTVSNSFILSLAVSDLITTIFVMPWDLEIILKKGSWSHGQTLCQFYTTVYLVSAPASTLNLLAVSIDRFRLIRDPFAYKRQTTPFRASMMITFIWVYSIVMAFLPLMGWKDTTSNSTAINASSNCTADSITVCSFDIAWTYSIMMSLLNFVIPPLIMTVIYFKIYRIASGHITRIHRLESATLNGRTSFNGGISSANNSRRSSRAGSYSPIHMETHCNGNHTYLTPPCANRKFPHVSKNDEPAKAKCEHDRKNSTHGNTEFEHVKMDIERASMDLSHLSRKDSTHSHLEVVRRNINAKRKSRAFSMNGTSLLRKNIKAAKSLAIIVGAFFLCWYPFTIVSMVANACFWSKLSCDLPPIYVEQLLLLFGFLNSMLNPFLYGLHNKEFKRTYKRILRWK